MNRTSIRILSAFLTPLLLAAGGCGSPAQPSAPPGTGTALPGAEAATPGAEAGTAAESAPFPLPDDRTTLYESLIASLEEQLLREKTDRYLSEAGYEEAVAALRVRLDELQGNARSVSAVPETREAARVPADAPPEFVRTAGTEGQTAAAPSSAVSFRYGIVDGGAVIYAVLGGGPDLRIPDTVAGYPVTGIADDAARGADITSVTLPGTVREIGWFAFADCPELQTAVLPASVTSVGYGAFSGCPALTVVCVPGTYAAAWAESFAIPTRVPGA